MKRLIHTAKGIVECRIEGNGGPTVLVLNGGHTHCDSIVANERLLLDLGYQVVIPSRPGYGQTPSSTGRSAEDAADAMAALLDALGIERATVMGISAAGYTTLQLAERHPKRVERLILQCALSHGGWVNTGMKLMIYMMFNPWVEGAFWAFFRLMLRKNPLGTLKGMMKQLTLLDASEVVDNMSEEQQQMAIRFLRDNRSGSGFLNDITHSSGDLTRITAPTLIIHSRNDGSNPFSNAEYSAKHIRGAELFESKAETHLMWFSEHGLAIEEKITEFLKKPLCA